MARIWFDAQGAILRLVQNDAEEQTYGAPPEAVGSIAFDESTNQNVLRGLGTEWSAFDCLGGVLHYHGTAVTLAPDSATKTNRRNFLEAAQQAVDGNQAYLALTNPTAAQVAAQVRALTRQVTALIRVVAAREADRIGTDTARER